MYGQTTVSFQNVEKPSTGGKGLACIGFAIASKIRDEYLSGECIWAVVSQKGFPASAKLFTALVAAMRKQKLVLIARYTYRADLAPKMMVLFPNTKHENPEHNSLLMYELFYKDNFVDISFPSLRTKKTTPTAEQYDAMDKFIDSMDLMGGDKDDAEQTELFKKLIDPAQQHMYRAIAHRSFNPTDSVLKADKDLMDMLTTPKKAEAEPHVQKIKELFPLQVIQVSSKAAFYKKLQESAQEGEKQQPLVTDDLNSSGRDLSKIGTVTPAEDFAELLHRGERFNTLATQIQKVVDDFVFKSLVLFDQKIIVAVFAYREVAKQKAPYQYNEWIVEFKNKLVDREKLDLWQKLIVDESLGLITAEESEMSTVTNDEANKFYQIDVSKVSDRPADDFMEDDDDDMNELLNDM